MTGQFAYPPDRGSQRQESGRSGVPADREGCHHAADRRQGARVFETEMTPLNGKKIVVKAWTDPEFAEKIVVDTPAAIAELDFPDGMAGAEGEHLQAVANTPGVHNLVISTLCSCFPWPVLGLPPYWYKDPASGPARPVNPARCSPKSAWICPPTPRSRCGTPAVTRDGSSFPKGLRVQRISPTRC